MSLKPCSVFFLKQHDYLKIQGATTDNKTFKSNFLFSLVAAQNKQKPT